MAQTMVAVAAHVDHVMNLRKRKISGQMRAQRPVVFELERVVMLDKQSYPVRIEEAPGGLTLHGAGGARLHVASGWVAGQPVWRGTVGGAALAMQVRPVLNGMALAHGGTGAVARVYTAREAALAQLMPEKKQADTSKVLLCPMPGLVKMVDVTVGQEVKAGEALCMVEAMKMENVLRAERDCVVKAILAKPGDSLAVDAVIMEFA